MSGSSVELQEVGCVSALSPRERRECLPVSVIAARREEWPTSQLTQRMNLQQQGCCHCKFFSSHWSPDIPAHGQDTAELPAKVPLGMGGRPAECDCKFLLKLATPSELQNIPNLYKTVAERNSIASLQKT
ncbi:uncharacterized protein LOC119433948 isoform X2 [Dermacentor silvarum]|uniref:uncharacterized protein LOC119433948 isoform X2 n=1 Tax=Dermacentor silvarum TaxID=543639 RepID=UPI002101BB18|nr:uncharacterized protein LOC119433948 isoform X2 [Dermacentor silvarum]